MRSQRRTEAAPAHCLLKCAIPCPQLQEIQRDAIAHRHKSTHADLSDVSLEHEPEPRHELTEFSTVFNIQRDLVALLRRSTFSRPALPRSVELRSLTTLRQKPIEIGAKVVRHPKHATFQVVEVAVPRDSSVAIVDRIQRIGVPRPLVRRG